MSDTKKKGTSVKLNALLGFLIVAGVSWGGTVLAASLPDPSVSILYLWANATTTTGGTVNTSSFTPVWNGTSFAPYTAVNDFSNALGPGSVQIQFAPIAKVTSSTGLITTPPIVGPFGAPGNFTTVDATLTVDFEVVGPTFGTVVPLGFAGLWSATGADSQTYVNLNLQTNNLFHAFCSGGSCPESPFSGSTTVRAGGVQQAILAAAAHTEAGQIAAESWIDPYFYIDPTWAAANPGYSVIVSAGIPNDPVPIPAAAWLISSALGLIGLRRRAAT
jgi:hypothetical protein